jgi:hypothetical protein
VDISLEAHKNTSQLSLFPLCRPTGSVHVYQVDRVSEWIAKNQREASRSLAPPNHTYISISMRHNSGSASSLLFLNEETLLVCLGKTVHCWTLPKSSLNDPSSLWRLSNPCTITCAAPFGSDMVVLGSDSGHLILVNWTQWTRELSFSSSEQRPTVVHEWMPYNKQNVPNDGPFLRMGIQRLHVETCSKASGYKHNSWGCCRIHWVTNCGWVLAATIESPSQRGDCKVLYTSPKVEIINADGVAVEATIPSWSLPLDPVAADTNTVLCWTAVPAVTKVLPHHNKLVLDSQPHILRSEKTALLWKDSMSNDAIHTITLPKGWKKKPKTIAVHPSREWIVAGVDKQLSILSTRG